MKCPFLRESRVKYCQAAPYKKVIELTADSSADLCTSSAFQGCAAFREQGGPRSIPPCPFLHESRAQVCSQDPAVRHVPCSDQAHARCVTENHRYCEIYLSATHGAAALQGIERAFSVRLPPGFFLTRNHMWLDLSAEKNCHIGLDALLTRVLGRVDKLSFITSEGEQCPSVVITIHGANLHLVFPNPMQITGPNAQVRVDPERILIDPYGAGWLFEGTEPKEKDIRSGLLAGLEAQRWMEQEVQRVSDLIHQHAPAQDGKKRLLAADGGFPVEAAIKHMRRHEISQFFDELFTNKEVM